MKQYLLTRMNDRIYSYLLHDQKAVEIHCDQADQESILGNIYIGKIKNIAKNIGAAFVEIAPGVTCHLALDDMKQPIYTKKGASKLPQSGDELLVQIEREGIKTKYPSVTTNLTLHGKYVLLTTGNPRIAVSSKLPKEKKESLLAFVQEWETLPNCVKSHDGDADNKTEEFAGSSERTYGWLFRTNAGMAAENQLTDELSLLRNQYQTLMDQAQYRTCFSCLSKMPSAYLTRLENLYDSDADQILTDDERLYHEISDYLTLHHPEDLPKLSFYQDRLQPMSKCYSLDRQLEQAIQERVWLKSGGYLIIQPTEALTAIDVNSGKFEGGKNREAAFLKLNLEAAREIARQLRLRNISGIIIVDFINMEEKASEQELLAHLTRELRRDPIPTTLVDMTKLSLVEITRKKKEKSLAQSCK